MSNQNCKKVSIVCAWYQREDFIYSSINSLLSQTHNDFEIIIVDDGSPNKNVKTKLLAIKDTRLRIISQKNKGFTSAISTAISESKGEYIAIHGAGDISHKDRIKKLADVLDSDSSIAAVGSGCTQYSANGFRRKRYFSPLVDISETDLLETMPFVHGTVMYRKSAYSKAGGYDRRFQYCSDWDLFFRLLKVGRIVGLNLPLYEQLIFKDGFSFSPEHKFKQLWFKERVMQRNAERDLLLDNSNMYLSQIDPSDKKYIPYTISFVLKCIFKLDFDNFFSWLGLLLKQIKKKFKASNI